MNLYGKVRKTAVAVALLPLLLLWASGLSFGAGTLGNGTATVSGIVSFELEGGSRRIDAGRISEIDAGLAASFEILQVVRIRPYFARPPRAPRTPEEERLSRIFQAEYKSHESPERAAAMLLKSPLVIAASPVPLREVAGLPDDTRFGEQWGFHQVGDFDMDLPEAWDVFAGDSTVVIAVLDTGLDRLHPDMGCVSPKNPGNVWVNVSEVDGVEGEDDDSNGFVDDIWGWDFVDYIPGQDEPLPWLGEDDTEEDGDPSDFHGHGTAVAGVAGAVGNNAEGVAGLLWRCRIMGLRCGLAVRGGALPAGVVRMDWCGRAVWYAAEMGAAAINASWESGYEIGLEAAVDFAISKGVVVSVAAGNRSRDPDSLEERNYLSSRGDCIDVAAVQENGRRRYDSNFGAWVDLSAPGSNILTLKYVPPDFRGYGLWSGTSIAAPAVAAAAALVKSKNPDWSAEQVRAHLQLTSRELSPPDTTIGSGLLNVFGAIRSPDGGWSVELGGKPATAILPVGGLEGTRALATGLSDGRAFACTVEGTPLASWPVELGGEPLSGLASGDCDGDGEPEIVFVDDGGTVSILDLTGSVSSSWTSGASPAGEPVLSDLDGDGRPEILLSTNDSRVHAWTADGVTLPGWPMVVSAAPAGAPASGDLDGLNGAEVVVACVDGAVHCISADGLDLPGWPVAAGVPVGAPPTLADVAGDDGVPEVIVGAMDGRLYVWDVSGTVPEGWPFKVGGESLSAGVSVGDLDGDETDEAVVLLGAGELAVCDTRGFLESGWPVSAPLDSSALLIADVTGDSIPEVLAIIDGVGVGAWDLGGLKIPNWPKPTDGAPAAGIAIGDYDGDGRAELLGSSAGGLLHCWDLEGLRYIHSAALWPLPACTPGNTRLALLSDPSGGPGPGPGSPFRVVSLRAAPNPMTAGTTITSELAGHRDSRRQAEVRIYDVAGRLIRKISMALRSPGVYRDFWNGRTDDDQRAPAGVYLCVVSVQDSAMSCLLILAR